MPHSPVTIAQSPFIRPESEGQWNYGSRGHWPCRWIEPSQQAEAPYVAAYRLRFAVEEAATVRIHVSGDERYALYLDGELLGRGPQRGDRDHWFYESFDLVLSAGQHVLVARVTSLGELAEIAQMSVRHGFLLAPEGEEWRDVLGTGHADWEVQILDGLTFSRPKVRGYYACGPEVEIDTAHFPRDHEKGRSGIWHPARSSAPAIDAGYATESPLLHGLRPATLPPQIETVFRAGNVRWVADAPFESAVDTSINLPDEVLAWQNLLAHDQAITIEPYTKRRVLIDLENYYCAFWRLAASGGAGSSVKLSWAEALHLNPACNQKGHRDQIEGGYFQGIGDTLLPDGEEKRAWESLEWSAGRYVELQIETSAEALLIESLTWRESRYPLDLEGKLESSDGELEKVWPILTRGVQMCAHETYMDCPFYERLMYAGDTRLQVLATLVMTPDDALPRHALRSFAWSQLNGAGVEGLTQSRYPSRLRQVIPPFALWWITMLHDFALWRGDQEFVRELMPIARGVMDGMSRFCNADGLLEAPNGWNFVDWVPTWGHGVPAEGVRGVGGAMNWTYALALQAMEALEAWQDEPELSTRWKRQRERVVAGMDAFWNEERGLFADDLTQQYFSEHANALSLAGGFLSPERASRVADSLESATDLARTTIYFSHYLLEAFNRENRTEALWKKLELWRTLPANGFVTPFEQSDMVTTRSDCHAWGSHPLYHFYASILGIRPTSLGFGGVEIKPQLGPLSWAKGIFPHPLGWIEVDLRKEGENVVGTVKVPEGVEATAVPEGIELVRVKQEVRA